MADKKTMGYHRGLFNDELARLKGHPYFGDVFICGEPDYDKLIPRYRNFVSSVHFKRNKTPFERQKKVLLLRSSGTSFADMGAETGYAAGSLSEAHRNGLSRLANYWRTPQILDRLYMDEYFETFMAGSWPVGFDVNYITGVLGREKAMKAQQSEKDEMFELKKSGIPIGTLNVLIRAGVKTPGQLSSMTDGELIRIGLLGSKRLEVVRRYFPNPVPAEQLGMELYPPQTDCMADIGLPRNIAAALKNEGISNPDELETFLLETGQKLADYRNRQR